MAVAGDNGSDTGSSVYPEAGAMGLDINADHLALALIDRHGNPPNKWTIPCHTFGKTSEQRQAVIGDACKPVVELAKQAGVPLVMEKLSFQKKKDELEKRHSARYARMLSGLAYDRHWSVVRTVKAWIWPGSTRLKNQ